MKIRAYILVVVVLVLFIGSQARADSTASREYQVKAAFLYNFIKFVDWPKEKTADSNEPIIIGIIGEDPFEKAFQPIKNKKVKGKKIVIKRFQGLEESKQSDEQTALIRKCHMLFICASEKEILMEDKKVVFEINNHAAKQARLKIRSKLLRLAKRVIPEKPSNEDKS